MSSEREDGISGKPDAEGGPPGSGHGRRFLERAAQTFAAVAGNDAIGAEESSGKDWVPPRIGHAFRRLSQRKIPHPPCAALTRGRAESIQRRRHRARFGDVPGKDLGAPDETGMTISCGACHGWLRGTRVPSAWCPLCSTAANLPFPGSPDQRPPVWRWSSGVAFCGRSGRRGAACKTRHQPEIPRCGTPRTKAYANAKLV